MTYYTIQGLPISDSYLYRLSNGVIEHLNEHNNWHQVHSDTVSSRLKEIDIKTLCIQCKDLSESDRYAAMILHFFKSEFYKDILE